MKNIFPRVNNISFGLAGSIGVCGVILWVFSLGCNSNNSDPQEMTTQSKLTLDAQTAPVESSNAHSSVIISPFSNVATMKLNVYRDEGQSQLVFSDELCIPLLQHPQPYEGWIDNLPGKSLKKYWIEVRLTDLRMPSLSHLDWLYAKRFLSWRPTHFSVFMKEQDPSLYMIVRFQNVSSSFHADNEIDMFIHIEEFVRAEMSREIALSIDECTNIAEADKKFFVNGGPLPKN